MQFRNLIEDWMEVEDEEEEAARQKPGTRITKRELNIQKDLVGHAYDCILTL